MAARPFKVHVSQERIDVLKRKLENATFAGELENAGWSQGPPRSDIQRLAKAWKEFDWRAAEDKINEHENFITPIEVDAFGTLDIHFIHQRSSDPDAIPLLFIHGWPGSFLEALKIKSLLKAPSPGTPSFHLVAPSLPNFGFSSGSSAPSFGLRQYASTLHKLMLSLSYPRYATQSGDWGYWIARALGHEYPGAVAASHYNMMYAAAPTPLRQPALYLRGLLTPPTAAERHSRARTAWFRRWSQGYNHLQSTRPQTLGYALADSPLALLAWVYEKLVQWSDAYAWSDDEVLTFVSVYWFSAAGPEAPQRIYYEVGRETDRRYTYEGMMRWMRGGVKLGFSYNPGELEAFPRRWARTLGTVVYEVENEHGGHFYAHEHPELLVRDLQRMFGPEINAYGR